MLWKYIESLGVLCTFLICSVINPFVTLPVQVVTAHAVRVAVTNSLSANITGFLPIHCIYQLLRSRAFTKHKVSIKVIHTLWLIMAIA